ncbi:MAG: hypothetical protein AAGG01_09515 [Planctomycetota bacterium]
MTPRIAEHGERRQLGSLLPHVRRLFQPAPAQHQVERQIPRDGRGEQARVGPNSCRHGDRSQGPHQPIGVVQKVDCVHGDQRQSSQRKALDGRRVGEGLSGLGRDQRGHQQLAPELHARAQPIGGEVIRQAQEKRHDQSGPGQAMEFRPQRGEGIGSIEGPEPQGNEDPEEHGSAPDEGHRLPTGLPVGLGSALVDPPEPQTDVDQETCRHQSA